MTDLGPETLATRRCEHGKLADDFCEKCELGDLPVYQAFVAYERATSLAWQQDGFLNAGDHSPRQEDRVRKLFETSNEKRQELIGALLKVRP